MNRKKFLIVLLATSVPYAAVRVVAYIMQYDVTVKVAKKGDE